MLTKIVVLLSYLYLVLTQTAQLFVGLSNGHVYQFDLVTLLEKGLAITQENLNDYLSFQLNAPILDMHIIDLQGNSQAAITPAIPKDDASSPSSSVHRKKSNSLSKENSHQSSDSTASTEEQPSPKPSNGSNNGSQPPSKRMAAIGKGEYKQQENPHFIVIASPQSVSVYLSGYNVKLFYKQLITKEAQVVRSQVIKHGGKNRKEKLQTRPYCFHFS